MQFETLLVHAGQEPDTTTGAVVVPISLASTFSQKGVGIKNGVDDINSFGRGYEYSRTGNPTRGAFERAIAVVEKGNYGLAFSSGLSATSAILQTLSAGDHIISIDDVYGGTQRLFRNLLIDHAKMEFTFLDMANPEIVEKAITNKTKIIWLESPTNPTLKITDIQSIAEITKKYNSICLVVDNTFMSPYLQNPLELGADIVLHSVTKYIGGHSDVLMGAIACNDENIYRKLKFIQNAVGAVPSPFDCYLALRGLKTLHVRLEAAQRNACAIATFLENHDKVESVIYPGLLSHPQHDIALKQQKGYGAMITFFIKGNIESSHSFLSNLKLFILAESLGAVESLAESPACMTHASVPLEERQKLGISDNLIRLSIGIEHTIDLIEDLKQALNNMI